ncbi:MAG: AraC family transcriptional regulator [Hyphomicrobiales bacterium]
MTPELVTTIDAARQSAGFLTISETLELASNGNKILDPFSVLISEGVKLGTGNTLYPGVTILARKNAKIIIGDSNLFQSSTLIEAVDGDIVVGNKNQFGEGGFTAKTNQPGSRITVGNCGRYMNNPAIYGTTELQDGTQILGSITAISCTLSGGSPYQEPIPDLRAGLLKGFGVAKNITVCQGQVICGQGSFHEEQALPQSAYHPNSASHSKRD